jgi:3-oxoacyl-[acyl-carrier protein] reductase
MGRRAGDNLGSVFLVTAPPSADDAPACRADHQHDLGRRPGRRRSGQLCGGEAGIVGFTMSVAKEVGSRGITANAVAPGYIATDLTSSLPEALIDEARRLTPLGRLGSVDDVAAAVAFLASDDAAFITAQVLRVDGGMII